MFVYDQAAAHEAVLAQYIEWLAQTQKELAVARAQIAQLEAHLAATASEA